jgi:hypothetical protein
MNRFNRLSDDEITGISLFLDIDSLNYFGFTCSSIYVCCQKDEIWYDMLQHQIFPSYIPFSQGGTLAFPNTKKANNHNNNRNNYYDCGKEILKKSSRYKIRNFKNKLFNMSSLGYLKTFKSRYLHRSVVAPNGTHYMFGGVGTSNDNESGSFSDVWRLLVDEGSKEIQLSKLKIIQTIGPGNSSAFGACVISTGDIIIFGGMVNGMFSTQFWKLNFIENKEKNSDLRPNRESIDLVGRWEDLRLDTILSDEQAAINEHMEFVQAHNNAIINEVNNQYNDDFDEDEEDEGDNDIGNLI